MSGSNASLRAIPAQLNFLTIYSPSLGPTDETFRDQILYHYSRQDHKARAQTRPRSKDDTQNESRRSLEEEENQKLRHIGLAQGMVEFAKTFSNGVNVDTIDTEKSRVILHEIEPGWWILASVDLTRLPTAKQAQDNSSKPAIEFSSREVSPATLLITELIQAHTTFLIHHGQKLSELFERVGRPLFCGLLERYWDRFLKDWDVLLHGNPATTIYNATKLAGGGELGVGVGEEEWGSGEREVLEGFMDRTEGLMDLVVGRYGEALPDAKNVADNNIRKPVDLETSTPWLGAGEDPGASDGVIFTGKGAISQSSLRTVSQWMEAIFKHGDRAYGISENPSSRPRQRRRRPRLDKKDSEESPPPKSSVSNDGPETHPQHKSSKARAPNLRKQAIENNAAPPGIPAPLVGQVERSLDDALAKASQRASSRSPRKEKGESEALGLKGSQNDESTFGADNMMKLLTLGYGSSWTLNPKGFKASKPQPGTVGQSERNSPATQSNNRPPSRTTADEQSLREVDPTPEVSDEEDKAFVQKLEHTVGRFLIGLSGDLEQTELDTDNENDVDIDPLSANPEQRVFLRTLTVELSTPRSIATARRIGRSMSKDSGLSKHSVGSGGSTVEEPKTSAAASVDGPQPNITHERVQVAIYIHQPFIFVFLFELHTPSLTMPAFYRSIHNQLGPLQKPLLRSTNPARVAERIAEAMHENSSSLADHTQTANTIYDLVYDPARLTVRTSIPNIPIPGSLAAEGLTSRSSSFTVSGSWYTLGIPIGTPQSVRSDKLLKSSWTRMEALNVHMQVLNSWSNTRNNTEIENTVKTGRGWWVLWVRVPSKGEDGGYREAFLVRKAVEQNSGKNASRTISSGPGKWLLRDQPREASGGSSSNSGVVNAKGVSDGVGVDARKWIDALLHLTQ